MKFKDMRVGEIYEVRPSEAAELDLTFDDPSDFLMLITEVDAVEKRIFAVGFEDGDAEWSPASMWETEMPYVHLYGLVRL